MIINTGPHEVLGGKGIAIDMNSDDTIHITYVSPDGRRNRVTITAMHMYMMVEHVESGAGVSIKPTGVNVWAITNEGTQIL